MAHAPPFLGAMKNKNGVQWFGVSNNPGKNMKCFVAWTRRKTLEILDLTVLHQNLPDMKALCDVDKPNDSNRPSVTGVESQLVEQIEVSKQRRSENQNSKETKAKFWWTMIIHNCA